MGTPTITFRQARSAGACAGSYRRMARHVGGITRFGRDTPLPIATVLDVLGLDDALWALDAAGYRRVMRLWACDCAERVLPIFERAHPDDRRPREAIRVARLYARGLATEAAMAAAGSAAGAAAPTAAWEGAAWDAARAASWAAYDARSAAWAAAWAAAPTAARTDAAWSAERAWQVERLRTYLKGDA